MEDPRRPPSRTPPFEPDPKNATLGDPPVAFSSSLSSDTRSPRLSLGGGVASTISKYGYTTAREPEVLTWTTSPLLENNSMLTKLFGEAFICQASHAWEIKGLAYAKGKLAQDNKIQKQRIKDLNLQVASLYKEQKDAVDKATTQMRKDLDDAKGKLKRADEENKRQDEA